MKCAVITALALLALIMSPARAAPGGSKTENASVPGVRIVGGYAAAIKDFPYQLSLRSKGSHSCGAAIINTTHGVTAAHCAVAYAVKTMSVHAGSAFRTGNGTYHKVTQMVVHPKFNATTFDYDVAVFKVTPRFFFSATTNAIALPAQDTLIADGTNSTVSGWGTLNSNATTLPRNLQAVVVPVVSQADCQAAYGATSITDRMLCAGFAAGGKDSCRGDSGGPQVAFLSGKKVLLGLVSWGNRCARANYYGVYTNVPSVVNWIQTNHV